jgi:hypothetical protein
MHVLPQVLLCEETVSLLGIRQYYKLVDISSSSSSSGGSSSSNGGEAPPTAELEPLASTAGAAAAAAAAAESAPAAADGSTAASSSEDADTAAGAASIELQQQQQQQQQQLSIKEQQQLLLLKVDALLQLLSTVSFHQVRLLQDRFLLVPSCVCTYCVDGQSHQPGLCLHASFVELSLPAYAAVRCSCWGYN